MYTKPMYPRAPDLSVTRTVEPNYPDGRKRGETCGGYGLFFPHTHTVSVEGLRDDD